MHSGLFDVLHDAGDHDDLLVIAKRIDIDFVCIFEKLVDQDGALARDLHRSAHVVVERRLIVDDDHGSPAEHIRRTDENGVSDLACNVSRFFKHDCRSVLRLRDVELAKQVTKSLTVFRQVDRLR